MSADAVVIKIEEDADKTEEVVIDKIVTVNKPIITPAPNSFTTHRKLVDYSSESDPSSQDSESDSTSSKSSCSGKARHPDRDASSSEDSDESSSEDDIEEVARTIEEVTITAPPEKCQEVGKVKNVLNNQVVIEPVPKLAPLNLDTVLFLEQGKKSFGRVDDVFGPITEPLYSVTLPSAASVAEKGIHPGMKVYYAPSMDHTSYVFLPDLIKMKGSDASWKHNQEAPAECQDFSDDEEEARARGFVNGKRGGFHQGNGRNFKKRNFQSRQPPSWMPPMDMYARNPSFQPDPRLAFNPNVPPPQAPPRFYYGQHPTPPIMRPPPPPPSAPSTSSTAPQQPPLVQDMRHWNKQ